MKTSRENLARLVLLGLSMTLIACTAATPPPVVWQPVSRDYWPTAVWQTSSPEIENLDPERLASLRATIASDLPFLHSLLIVRHGRLVYEEYFNGYDAASLNDVRSVTKSVTSIVAGIAQQRGDLSSPDVRLVQAAPSLFEGGRYADKRNLALRHLLMMRSGVRWNESAFYDQVAERGVAASLQQDVNQRALEQPVGHKPGTWWSYSTLDLQLASALLEGATGRPLKDYAAEHLFAPLGISSTQWDTDSQGHTIGGGGLYLTARDMAKIGYLVLNRGQWDGQEIVSPDWIRLTTTPQASAVYSDTGQIMPIEWYGYGWWTWSPRLFGGQRAIAAQGYGGQLVILLPSYDMVVVTTANADVPPEASERQMGAAYDLVIYKALAAITAAPSSDPFWSVPEAPIPPHDALFAAQPDGKRQRTVATDAAYGLWSPAWSPDGQEIVAPKFVQAVMRPGSGPTELYLYDAQGEPGRQLTHQGRSNYLPAWSPDGKRIAYVSQKGANQLSSEICVIDVDGSNETCLTDNAVIEYGVSWSPDGNRLIFGTQRDGAWNIYTMNADGSDPQPLANPATGNTPRWSPDGKRIVFTSEQSGNPDIYIMDADGSNQRPIAAAPGTDYMPTWSPDGKQIAFISDRGGGMGVFVVSVDGSDPRRVSAANIGAIAPSWSPDGEEILFAGTEAQAPSLFERVTEWFRGVRS